MPTLVFVQLPFMVPYIYQNIFPNCLSVLALSSVETLHGDLLEQCPPHDK